MVVVAESLERVLLGWGSEELSDERLLERGMELVEVSTSTSGDASA